MKKAPGFTSGVVIGTLCLIAGLVMMIWAPNFSGFFDRGHSEPVLSIWRLLFGFAVLNFIFAWISQVLYNRNPKADGTETAGEDEQDPGANW